MKNILILSIIAVLYAGCASKGTKTHKTIPIPSTVKTNLEKEIKGSKASTEKVTLESLAIKLDGQVEEAVSKGKDGIRFLSGELFLKAADASIRGDSATAAFFYKYLLKLNPEDDYISMKYALELVRTGKLSESKGLMKKLFEKSKYKDTRAGLILAGIYSALGKNKKSQVVYKKLIGVGYNQDACIFLAKSYSSEKKFAKALGLLSKCDKKLKGVPEFSYYKGKIYLEKRQIKKAKKFFRKSLKIDSDFYKGALALGIMSEEKENYKDAAKTYESFLKDSPDNYFVLSRLVKILFIMGDYKKIIPYAESLTSIDQEDLNLKVRLGILYTDAKRYDDAKGIFKEILQVVPNSDKVIYYLASLHQQTGNVDEAIKHFSKITQGSKLFHDSNIQMAKILNSQITYSSIESATTKEKIELFKRFVFERSKASEDLKVELNVMMAGIYEKQKEFKEAIFILNGLRTYKSYNESHDYYLASLLEKDNRFPEARTVIEGILKKKPDNPHALNFLGFTMLEIGEEMDLALKYIKRALQLRPKDGYIRDSLGWYYYKTGDIKRALKEVKKAWETVKDDLVVTKHLAIIYQDMQKYDKAQQYFVKALENCKVENERLEVLEALENLQKLKFHGTTEKLRLPASKKAN